MTASVEPPAPRRWQELLRLALEEDLGPGDVTSRALIPPDRTGAAVVEARQELVVCGLSVARACFEAVEPRLHFEAATRDGARVAAGTPLARVRGPLAGLLAAERTALNFLMRMCGVASFTRRFVDAVDGTGAAIVDTRKTLPGWRALDKYATAVGGAINHRVGLFDGVLLKDNHVALAGGVAAAVKAARASAPANLRVQIEVESLEDALAAIEAGADFLLLDNRTPEQARAIVQRLAGRALLEASGGIGLHNVREMAETGVQRISIGALTHSAPAADVALEILPEEGDEGRPGAAPGGVTE
jgi:nicotinate-nucleotide pyrophosphorylase (carboxylating)